MRLKAVRRMRLSRQYIGVANTPDRLPKVALKGRHLFSGEKCHQSSHREVTRETASLVPAFPPSHFRSNGVSPLGAMGEKGKIIIDE